MRLSCLILSSCLLTSLAGTALAEKNDKFADIKAATSLTDIENMKVGSNVVTPVNNGKDDIRPSSLKLNERLRSTEERMNRDEDGDDYSIVAGDCDDADPTTYPGAYESADGIDNDCDGFIDNNIIRR